MDSHQCHLASAFLGAVALTGSLAYLVFKNWGTSKDCGGKCFRFNTTIDLDNPKVVHSYNVDDITTKTAYCRCWKSKKFPYCDGAHSQHNKSTGDNLGPVVLLPKSA